MPDQPAKPKPVRRLDAHIHLFKGGYKSSFSARPGVAIDEPACYASLMRDHHVEAALIVGYEGAPWALGNNAHIAEQAAKLPWARPLAFVARGQPLSVARLEQWRRERFVGITFYIFSPEDLAALAAIPDDAWSWLESNRWLVSVNSRGANWAAWPPILERHGERHGQLRLLVSHLGLPPRVRVAPDAAATAAAMGPVLALARFPRVHVKLSGFYALTDPGHAYPHRAAWPYVESLVRAFTAERLLWASDFSPHLDNVTFPQTCTLFEEMPFLTDAQRERITGANLGALLAELD
ncbi:MAG: amidohydrolase family protein [Planctomycetota bacterium]|nr:amidohydrolase family protein [Planctomycetota bacterium]